jgi:hypothetical protein
MEDVCENPLIPTEGSLYLEFTVLKDEYGTDELKIDNLDGLVRDLELLPWPNK